MFKTADKIRESYFFGVGSHYKQGYRALRHSFRNQIGEIISKAGRRSSTLLDVGCAFGYLVEDALESGIEAYGIDVSRYALSQAPKPDVKGRVVLVSALSIPFRDRVFDVVTAFEVVEHLSSPLQSLKELHRVLKDGGFLFLSTPIPNPSTAEDVTHISVKDPVYWISNLEKVDFQVTSFYHAGPFHRNSTKKWIRALFSLPPYGLSRSIEDVSSRILGRLIAYRFHKFALVARRKPSKSRCRRGDFLEAKQQ